jgi:hypothetical protein
VAKPVNPLCHCGHDVEEHQLLHAAYRPKEGRAVFRVYCQARVGSIIKSGCGCTNFRSKDEGLSGPSA